MQLLRLLIVSQQAQVSEFVGAAELLLHIAITTLRRLPRRLLLGPTRHVRRHLRVGLVP